MDFSILQLLFGESKSEKIQKCIHSFIISYSIISNKEYSDNMREFINEIMIQSGLSIKNIDKLYENIDETIIRHINYQLNGQIRKDIILASQREDMTEKEADLISRFDLEELIESVFIMYTYLLFRNVTINMNLIPTLVDFKKSKNEKIANLHFILGDMINNINEILHTNFEEESHKVFYHIIMTDEHLTILKKYISALIKMVLHIEV